MITKPNSNKLFETQNYKDSPILKALERELGYTATHSMLSYISGARGMSKQEILSDYETFSRIVRKVYGDAGEKHVLDKLSNIK